MLYVFDTNTFRAFQNYYPDRFPTLWERFGEAVSRGEIISVREVRKELDHQLTSKFMIDWTNDNSGIFSVPSGDEMEFVRVILAETRFQNLVPLKKRLQSAPVADPFIIAAAKIKDGCVVTLEEYKPNAAKIPNVCDYFNIPCTNIEGYMEREDWTF